MKKYATLFYYLLIIIFSTYFLWENIQLKSKTSVFDLGLTIEIGWSIFVIVLLTLLFYPKTLSFLKIPSLSYGLLAILFGLGTSFLGVTIKFFSPLFSIFPLSLDASVFPPISTFLLCFIVILLLRLVLIKKMDRSSVITWCLLYIVFVLYFHFLFLSNFDYYLPNMRIG